MHVQVYEIFQIVMDELSDGCEGEDETPIVSVEKAVEDVFKEAEERGGLKWRSRGILPVIVVTILNWLESFPKQPVVVRGDLADKLCCMASEVKQMWNAGKVGMEAFLRNSRSTVLNRSNSLSNPPGFLGSRSISFELPWNCVQVSAPEYISLSSKACLATTGPWFTNGHIESAGGESIARLESGRKLWIIASNIESSRLIAKIQTFQEFHHLLMSRSQRSEDCPEFNGLRYHLALPGDVLIQPPCYAHCVLTGRSEGWALVHGWEGLNLHDVNRANVVFDRFCLGVGKGVVYEWLQRHSTEKLVKLLRIRDWKKALKKWKLAMSKPSTILPNDFPSGCIVDPKELSLRMFCESREVTQHVETFWKLGYDLKKHLRGNNSVSRKRCFKKNRRLANLSVKTTVNRIAPTLKPLSSDEEDDIPLAVLNDIDFSVM